MRQTLFRIPLDGPWSLGPLGKVPGFGLGIALALWTLFAVWWLLRNRGRIRSIADLVTPAGLWIVVAAVIVLLPRLVQRSADAVIAQADRAIESDPHSTEALLNRSQARFSKRQYALAADDLRAALNIDPRLEAALARLAWIQATCPDDSVRNGAEAVANAEKACTLTSQKQPNALSALAAAQAEHGDFVQAAKTQRAALRLTGESTDPATIGEIPRMREQLQSYESERPYRDETAGKSIPIFGFGAMLFIGFIAGAWTAGRRGARIGYSPEVIWDAGIWIFIAGVVGCRIFYCIQYANRIFYNFEGGQYVLKRLPELVYSAVDLPDGGLVYYGGIPAAVIVGAWICRKRHLNLLDLGDIVIPSLFLGMAFGRIGCFLNGCCYGDQCSLPWGVRFPMGSVPDIALVLRGWIGADQDFSIRLHPTQLYSSLDGFVLYFLTSSYFPYRARRGAVMALGALTYPLTRFAVESLRGDELGQFNTSLTISQWMSIVMFTVGVAFALWLSRRPKLSPGTRISAAGA
jgi:phosphatidylglycerol---prolipoprotein diacylglyceryl transferase